MKKMITALTVTAAISTYGLTQDAEASTHTVKPGDTLWSISQKNNVSVSQLKSWNKLSSNLIRVNQNLKVSGSDSTSTSQTSSASSSDSKKTSASASKNKTSSNASSSTANSSSTYTVKSGDTLFGIARAHGMNYRTLMKNNNLSSATIHPGQKLSVGSSTSSNTAQKEVKKETPAETVGKSNTSSSTSASGSTYTVKSGDTLSSIARAHGMNYRTLMKNNNLSSTIIHPGQKLSVGSSSTGNTKTETVEKAPASKVETSNTSSGSNVKAPSPSNVTWGTNWYTDGECTWYAFERRKELGKPVGTNWGNASTWAKRASTAGYAVNNEPSVGAIMQADAWTNYAWGMGHVAIVEKVNSNGSIVVSEMNFGSAGPGEKVYRTLTASQAANHNFIH